MWHKIGLLLLAFALSRILLAEDFPRVVDAVRPSIVAVGTAYPAKQPNIKGDPVSYRGTGFVVGNGLQIITNAHVVPDEIDAENNEMLVVFSGRGAASKAHPARVIKIDKARDLALLAIRGTPLPAMTIGDSDLVREGQEVAFSGYPIGIVLGLYPVTHKGIVAAITPMARPVENARALNAAQIAMLRRNRFDAFQLDATAYPGNSGSPLYLPSDGKVIGVINSVFVKESKESVLERPSGISYAIPAKFVKALITEGH